ncbi:MAG TPA: ferrochelatase [Gemmatimonadota bacterium]|nr:ferrochelatase [Gemmatimonadota bacterium]
MRRAVLVMSYGTPERLEDVEAYYTHIRRGSPPPPELLDDLVERYRAVGGPTALNRITRDQAAGIERSLADRGTPVPVYTGFKHVTPFIGETVERMAADGIGRVVGLVLAPHYSLRSIAEYARYAEDARPEAMELHVIRSWGDHPGFVDFLAQRLEQALARAGQDPIVVFTAHSVPRRAIEEGDPYPEQLRETCALVAARTGLARWELAFQSAGRTTDPWIGPDILDVIDRLADAGETCVVVQAIGFVADHLEILYDLDIEARRAAELRGLSFTRAEMPNRAPAFINALADIVCDAGRL